MAIQLTTFTSPSALMSEFDQQRPNGLAKEFIARAVAMHLLRADLSALIEAHDLIAHVIDAAAGSNVVNAVVKALIASCAVIVPAGRTLPDAAVVLAGALAEVLNNQPRAFKAPESSQENTAIAPIDPYAALSAQDELVGLDLLSPSFEPLRFVLTRTIETVRPDLYQQYRRIKDCASATAREDAYQFAFGVLRKLIEKQTET